MQQDFGEAFNWVERQATGFIKGLDGADPGVSFSLTDADFGFDAIAEKALGTARFTQREVLFDDIL